MMQTFDRLWQPCSQEAVTSQLWETQLTSLSLSGAMQVFGCSPFKSGTFGGNSQSGKDPIDLFESFWSSAGIIVLIINFFDVLALNSFACQSLSVEACLPSMFQCSMHTLSLYKISHCYKQNYHYWGMFWDFSLIERCSQACQPTTTWTLSPLPSPPRQVAFTFSSMRKLHTLTSNIYMLHTWRDLTSLFRPPCHESLQEPWSKPDALGRRSAFESNGQHHRCESKGQ